MYYHFAFMAISIALFGLSASGVYVFLMRDRWRDTPTEKLLAGHAFAFTVVTAGALAVLVRMQVGLNYSPSNIAMMSAVYLLSALPFFFGGAAITLVDHAHERQHQRGLRRGSAWRRRPVACC